VIWAVNAAEGLGPIMEGGGLSMGDFLPMFVPALTATMGFWSTLSLNMPDFTRYGRSQREQAIGQVIALPSTMTVFAAMGIMITSATAIVYGAPISDPIAP
jgi:NCS1 family nucleobase:cation symporter-1